MVNQVSEGSLMAPGYNESQGDISNNISSTFNVPYDMALNDQFIKLNSCYDNEFSYSNKVVGLMGHKPSTE